MPVAATRVEWNLVGRPALDRPVGPITGAAVPAPDLVDEAFIRQVDRFFTDVVAKLVASFADDMTPVDRARAYRHALSEAGLAGLTVPCWAGGRGRSKAHHDALTGRGAQVHYDLDKPSNVGVNMAVPTLVAFANADLVAAEVPATLRGDRVWCQLYSEPDAGSDLASIATRGVRDGDEWIVTGQKVWTSGAQHADRGIALVRTNPDAAKRQGISMMVIDMHAPGVTVRPLHQMTGGSEFNEVFLDGVRVHESRIVGQVDDGWRIALALLGFERDAQGAGVGGRQPIPFTLLRGLAESVERTHETSVRQDLAALYANQRIIGWLRQRAHEDQQGGRQPGPASSLGKLWRSRQGKAAAALAARLAFPAGAAWDAESDGADWAFRILDAPGLSIGGGTDEIQRNTIAEKVLGLPR